MRKAGIHPAMGLLLFLASALLLSTGAVRAKHSSTVPEVVLLCVDSLTLQDVTTGGLPNLKEAFDCGASALLNTNVAGTANLDSAYLTLGAGARARATEYQPGYMPEEDLPGEEGTVADIQRRRTGNSDGAVLQPSIAVLASGNSGLGYTVQIGALGTALREADHTMAIIGCADTHTRERPLVNMLMDNKGSVPYGYIGTGLFTRDPVGPFGFWTSGEAVLSEALKYKERVNIIAIEWADLYRAEKYALFCKPVQAEMMRKEALNRLDQFVEELLAKFSPDEHLVIILSPSYGVNGFARGQGLTPIVMWGPNVKSGHLMSSTTRRQGLMANIDVAASILAHFHLPVSNSIIGRPVTIVPAENRLDALELLEQRATGTYLQRPLVLRLFIVYLIVVLAFSMLAALLKHRLLSCAVHRLLLAGVVVPLLFLLLPLLPPLSLEKTVAVVIVLASIPAIAAHKPIPSHDILLLTAIATLLVLVIDIFFAQSLVSSSLLGYCFISGARYYGLGNEYMGIFIGAFFVIAGSIIERFRFGPRQARFGMLMGTLTGSYFLGASRLGANAGGTLAFTGGAWAAYLWLGTHAVNRRKVLRSLITVCLSLLILMLADWHFSSESSHIGRALDLIRQLGPHVAIGIMQRKASMNLKLLRYSLWSRVLLMLIMALLAVFFGPYSYKLRLQRDNPLLTACLRGALIAAILALIANDSGVVAAATALLFPTVLLILLALPFSDKKSAKISND